MPGKISISYLPHLFLLVVGLLSTSFSFAQKIDSTMVSIETDDGNQYLGIIIEEDNDVVKLSTTKLGDLILRRSDIVKITTIASMQVKNGSLWTQNLQATRYFF